MLFRSPPARAEGPATGRPLPVDDEQARAAGAVPLRRPQGRRRHGAWVLSAAAGVAGVLVVGGLAAGLLGGSDETTSSAGSAGGGGSEESSDLALQRVPVTSSGTSYRAADGSIARALPGLLVRAERQAARSASEPGAAPPPPARGLGDDPLARLRDPAELAGCLSSVTGAGGPPPLAVDYAALEGRPALVVVLPVPGESGKVDVHVLGAGCRAGDAQTLLSTRLSRPG